jgi:hypothetical protein
VHRRDPPTREQAKIMAKQAVASTAAEHLLKTSRTSARNSVVSNSTLSKILTEVTYAVKVQTTTIARQKAEANMFNTITLVACKEALRFPFPSHPTFQIASACEWNFDTTSFGINLIVEQLPTVLLVKNQSSPAHQTRKIKGAAKTNGMFWKLFFAGSRDGNSAPVVLVGALPEVSNDGIMKLKIQGLGRTHDSIGEVWLVH